jgi:hypothetical protein
VRGSRAQKEFWIGSSGEEKGVLLEQSETILLLFARAGLNSVLLFLLINRVLGLLVIITLWYRTHMTIYFEHLRVF